MVKIAIKEHIYPQYILFVAITFIGNDYMTTMHPSKYLQKTHLLGDICGNSSLFDKHLSKLNYYIVYCLC